MSNVSQFLGGNIPIGAIVTGQFEGNPNYLPCDGSDNWLAADYPQLDKTNLASWRGNDWVARTLPASCPEGNIAFGNGVYVLMPGAGSISVNTYFTSTDGVTWTQRTFPATSSRFNLAFGNGIFVAAGSGTAAYSSPDGINWTLRSPTGTGTPTIAYSASAGIFLIAYAGISTTHTSPDGITWTARAAGIGGATNIDTIRVVDGVFYAFVNGNSGIYFSKEGILWGFFSILGGVASVTAIGGGGGVLFVGSNMGLTRSSGGEGYFDPPNMIPGSSAATFAAIPSPIFYASGRHFARNASFIDGAPHDPYTTGVLASTEAKTPFAQNGNRIVMAANSSNAVYTLDVNTARFRTPRMRRREDGARFYIRAR